MNTARPGVLVAVTVAAIIAVPAHGMIRTLSLLELVKQSDVIVTAVVETVTEVGKGRDVGGLAVADLRNELKPLETLKGSWPKEQAIVLSTIKPRKGWLEDNVEIPPAGSQVLVFLTRLPDGRLVPVNGIQGVWRMESGKPQGMGFGKSLADVRDAIKKSHAAAIFAQGVALQKQADIKGAVEKYKESLRDWPDIHLQDAVWSLEARLAGRVVSMTKTDDIPCGQADQNGEDVPSDFSITSGGGPAHADWGGASAVTVTAKGEVISRADIRPGQTEPAPARQTIDHAAVKRIYAQALACGFFDLEKEYWDRQVMDGGSNYVSVTANGKTHTVTLVNYGLQRIWSIVRVLDAETRSRK